MKNINFRSKFWEKKQPKEEKEEVEEEEEEETPKKATQEALKAEKKVTLKYEKDSGEDWSDGEESDSGSDVVMLGSNNNPNSVNISIEPLTLSAGAQLPDLSPFAATLNNYNNLSVDAFKEQYGKNRKYIDSVTIDATKAKYFDHFQDASKRPKNNHYRPDSFTLSAPELAMFKKNGFVVSSKPCSSNWSREYYRIFNNDLPVFVTADSMLHAFHMSYDAAIMELESTYFLHEIKNILFGMKKQIPDLASVLKSDGPLKQALRDVDIYLTVPLNLLSTTLHKCTTGADREVAACIKACEAAVLHKLPIFGQTRDVDFSQFKPRGHYTKTTTLTKYFKAMMWLGRIDMKIAAEDPERAPEGELAAAIVLYLLLSSRYKPQANSDGVVYEKVWEKMNGLLECLVGKPNSMTFTQLGSTLEDTFKLKDINEVNNSQALRDLQLKILNDETLGTKAYNSDYAESTGAEKVSLPRAFTFMGQRFAIDSWATSKVVADAVFWNNQKVLRKGTSAIETAFSVFGNDATVPLLCDRIRTVQDPKFKFRDGLPYQHNLAAVRDVVDKQSNDMWNSTVYTKWLETLRGLSINTTTNDKYPQAMRTEAYAMKNLNAQLGSWAQLRHDNLLYVEQPGDFTCGCSYPAGYVEPLPEFWKSLEELSLMMSQRIQESVFPDLKVKYEKALHWEVDKNLKEVQGNQTGFFLKFAKRVRMLRGIVDKELSQKPLTSDETDFLKHVMEGAGFMSGMSMWSGWYCGLFYGGYGDADEEDLIVSDVYTSFPDPLIGCPGGVLHEGLGKPHLMTIAIDSGDGDVCTYAGPVYSHYEVWVDGLKRFSDAEWEKKVKENSVKRPEWCSSFMPV